MAQVRFLDQVPIGVYEINPNDSGGVSISSASIDLGTATTLNFTGSSLDNISISNGQANIEISSNIFPFLGSAEITGSLEISGSLFNHPITNATGSIVTISPSGLFQKRTQAETILDINGISNATDNFTSTSKVFNIVTLTQAEYDAIVTKNNNTLYIII
jgi:hypothetical protein